MRMEQRKAGVDSEETEHIVELSLVEAKLLFFIHLQQDLVQCS